jgi:hypothetical protein
MNKSISNHLTIINMNTFENYKLLMDKYYLKKWLMILRMINSLKKLHPVLFLIFKYIIE